MPLVLSAQANVHTTRTDGFTLLQTSVQSGYADTLALLIDEGADGNAVRKDGITALMLAARNAKEAKCVDVLLRYGADPNLAVAPSPGAKLAERVGTTPLHLACRNGYDDCVRSLLKGGANVEAQITENGVDEEGYATTLISITIA